MVIQFTCLAYLNYLLKIMSIQDTDLLLVNRDGLDYKEYASAFASKEFINSVDNSSLVYNTSETSTWLGEAAPKRDPLGSFGWYFKNDGGNKIQWKVWTQQRSGNDILILDDILSASLVLKAKGNYYPFIQIYTKKKNDGQDAGSWYRSRISYSTSTSPNAADGRVFLTSNPDTTLYKSLKRIALTEGAGPQSPLTEAQAEAQPKVSVGPADPDEEIKEISIGTGSSQPDGDFEFTLSNLVIHTTTGTLTALLNGNDDLSNYYSKAQVDALLATKADA